MAARRHRRCLAGRCEMTVYSALFVDLALALGLILCAAGWTAVPASTISPAGPTFEATVTRTIDGHSLDAHVEGRRTAVGYLGVETPPVNQPCGAEALAR